MTVSELYARILDHEQMCAEDLYDLGGLCIFEYISNLDALNYLKDTRPLIYKHICDAYMDSREELIAPLVESKSLSLEKIPNDYIFVFNYEVKDENLYNELCDVFDDGEPYKCLDDELWKVVIAILGSHFEEAGDYLISLFDFDEDFDD